MSNPTCAWFLDNIPDEVAESRYPNLSKLFASLTLQIQKKWMELQMDDTDRDMDVDSSQHSKWTMTAAVRRQAVVQGMGEYCFKRLLALYDAQLIEAIDDLEIRKAVVSPGAPIDHFARGIDGEAIPEAMTHINKEPEEDRMISKYLAEWRQIRRAQTVAVGMQPGWAALHPFQRADRVDARIFGASWKGKDGEAKDGGESFLEGGDEVEVDDDVKVFPSTGELIQFIWFLEEGRRALSPDLNQASSLSEWRDGFETFLKKLRPRGVVGHENGVTGHIEL